ncbi:MAG: transcription termination/antitermination factor NusG [Candidatus Omnitrophota bacterium]|nr:MAG: transcription termination/antitermination factor NusG [Candidatus Omnitrophota bacterium]
MAKKWYVIHAQTGFEERVKASLEKRMKQTPGASDFIAQIVIPTEQVAEIKGGKKKISQRKFFPGYVLVEMELNDKSWYFIKRTPGVTGFVGPRSMPTPLTDTEIKNILKQTETTKAKPIPRVTFEKGEAVRVKEGPFNNFNGSVEEVNPEKGKIKVSISIFGRSTPVELEMWQIEKV